MIQITKLYSTDIKFSKPIPTAIFFILLFHSILLVIVSPFAIVIQFFIIDLNITSICVLLFFIPILTLYLLLIYGMVVSWFPDNVEIYDDRVVVIKPGSWIPFRKRKFELPFKTIIRAVKYEYSFAFYREKDFIVANFRKFDKEVKDKIKDIATIILRKQIKVVTSEENKRILNQQNS